jgi:AraC-like DNA-binding protein
MSRTGISTSAQTSTLVANDFQEWKSIVSESFVPLEVQSDQMEFFKARMRSKALGEVFISQIDAKSHVVQRTPNLIARGDTKYFKLSLQLAGTGLLIQDNREAALKPGDLAIYDTDRPYTLSFDSDFRSLVVMVPQAAIDIPRDVVGQLTATKMSGDSGLTKVIGPFLTHLAKNMDDITGHSGLRLMNNAMDMITTLLQSQLDMAQIELPQGHRATLLNEIRTYIDEHLSDADLDPGSIAAANYISTRHLHGIFKEEGVTVSAWIRSRRLEHCRRELADPLHIAKPVSCIALRWGFVDASHFSRLFRATFGETPSEYRAKIWPNANLR